MTNAASERGIAKRRQRATEDLAHTEITLRTIMSTKSGRRWMWLQLSAAHCFHGNFHDQPIPAARQEGARALGLALLLDVQRVCPRQYIEMTTENTGVELEQQDDNPDAL